jgi:hypothetical protein
LDRDSCIFDDLPKDSGDNTKGIIFAPYTYRFSKQNNATQSIQVDRKDITGRDAASNSEGYISGSGNNFTIFALEKITGLLAHTEIKIISGQLAPSGIANCQVAFYLLSKDKSYRYTPVGTTRIFVDQDGMAERITAY